MFKIFAASVVPTIIGLKPYRNSEECSRNHGHLSDIFNLSIKRSQIGFIALRAGREAGSGGAEEQARPKAYQIRLLAILILTML